MLFVVGVLWAGGCDFHEEPPPLDGSYVSDVFRLNWPDTTFDIVAAGGRMEMQLNGEGENRIVSGRLVIPEATLSERQRALDTTFSGSYFEIVSSVKISFDQRAPLVPARWEYDHGVLRSVGQPEIVLVKR